MTAKKSSTKRVVKSTPKPAPKSEGASRSVESRSGRTLKKEEVLPFSRKNYILLLIGVAIIALGFYLLSIGDFVDSTEFSIPLYIAPLVIVGGFVEVIFAIMYKEKS